MKEFVVEVKHRPDGELSSYIDAVAQTFNIAPQKAERLLQRLPGVVTKPVAERMANEIAERLQQTGIDATVRNGAVREPQTVPPSPQHREVATSRKTSYEAGSPVPEVVRLAEPVPRHPTPTPTPPPDEQKQKTTPALPTFDTRELLPETSTHDDTFRSIIRTAVPEMAPPTALPQPEETAAEPTRRGSILAKLLSIALLPTLLAIIGALVVTWFVVRPALYDQLLDSARNPAIAAAASLSSILSGNEDAASALPLRLLETIQIARQTFPRESIGFIVATDAGGNPLPALFESVRGFDADTRSLENAIREQALLAISRGGSPNTDRADATSQLALPSGERFEIVAQPLLGRSGAIGTIVVGVTDAGVSAQVNRILLSTLLFSLIPLALAVLFAVTRARTFTHNIVRLTRRADEISRGNLDERVDNFRSNDELENLSEALERLRVSMQEAMTRLRRRRS